jgi:hypothetical protein
MLIPILKILGGLLALGLGVYWGWPGQYRPDPEELDQALGPGGRTRKVKRSFTPLSWLRGMQERPSHSRRRSASRRFSLVEPDPPKKEKSDKIRLVK